MQCSVAMTLQCSAFELPSSCLCWQAAFTYNGNRVCGSSTALQNPVNVERSLKVNLYGVGASGPGFNCTVTCGNLQWIFKKRTSDMPSNGYVQGLSLDETFCHLVDFRGGYALDVQVPMRVLRPHRDLRIVSSRKGNVKHSTFHLRPCTVPIIAPNNLLACGISRIASRSELYPRENPAKGTRGLEFDRTLGVTPVPNQGKFPWMVRVIQDHSDVKGPASMIDMFSLLPFVSEGPPGILYATLGDLDRSTSSESQSVDIPAIRIMHPGLGTPTNIFNDIGLLRLQTPVNFQIYPHIRPMCLSSSSAIPRAGETVTIAAWGGIGGEPASMKLMETTMKVRENCDGSFGSLGSFYANFTSFICAEGAVKVCYGYGECSGRPLMYQTRAGYYEDFGVIANTSPDCWHHYDAVFTKTASYVDYIKNSTGDAQWCPPPGSAS
ncbi:unnamed protein product [Darwinula stevensoni]|uniref:Peptidase S1 domain-containing protein n=1 Tax=Darwinula stevensoni TaxID=69355 RepID=A0A7R8X9I7_9CRUS|nr:unnamed protein product [Darwinula stevensoni]CAG0885611.1 unnamed protein product [Darwinula stevensoni]